MAERKFQKMGDAELQVRAQVARPAVLRTSLFVLESPSMVNDWGYNIHCHVPNYGEYMGHSTIFEAKF
jgi:hypothetical protein